MQASRRIRISQTRGSSFNPDWRRIGALVVFGMMVTLGPLAFGAVDRVVQTGLVLLLAIGAFLRPPALAPFVWRGNAVLIALVAVLVLKEFLPHQLFLGTRWRNEAVASLGIEVPWTHHPEPARAFDGLLTVVIAIFWLHWIRTLAAHRETRLAMAWILLGAGVAVAGICFTMKANPGQTAAIFGIRNTPGWGGWGPFPNRNHTASLLAMAAVAGLGCVAWAVIRRRKPLAIAATVGVLMIVVALLISKSRGGLVAFGVGFAVFGGMILWKHRDRRAVAVVAGGLAVVALCVAVFGTQVIGRFSSEEGTHISNTLRVSIWKNAFAMWKDAPFFGHGIETFRSLFPFYQNLTLDDNVVLHPESSWMQWLIELGLIPLTLVVAAFARLLFPRLAEVFERRGTFYLSAGVLAAFAALVAHAAIDVPAHRWGTAGYALTLLGLACPVATAVKLGGASQPRIAMLPLAIGIFWALPFFGSGPAWQPVVAEQMREREVSGRAPRPTLADWKGEIRYFPFERDLHHFAGLRELEYGLPKTADWQRHFEIVNRLAPGSWRYPISHARAVKRVSPALCIQYWQLAIERSGWRGMETLGDAVRDTSGLPLADAKWADYVTANPELALAYAKLLPDEDARRMYQIWWNARGTAAGMSDGEIADFYRFAARWAVGDQVGEWIRRHGKRRRADYRIWMSLLHNAGRDERAWNEYKLVIADPPYPAHSSGATRDEVELRLRLAPDNSTHLVELVRILDESGDSAGARRMIMEVAWKQGALTWFLRKAAYQLAADGKFGEAVAMALREK